MKKYYLVQVEWIDSCGEDYGWDDIESIEEVEPARITTVGFRIKETKEKIILALSVDFDNDQASSYIVIPTAVIKGKKTLCTYTPKVS